jgi:hypothetical protein
MRERGITPNEVLTQDLQGNYKIIFKMGHSSLTERKPNESFPS